MRYTYTPTGVCSREFEIDLEGNKIKCIKVIGGCPGNTIGLAKLLEGMDVNEAISKLKGIKCGMRSTSCPDQIAKALEKIIEENKQLRKRA